MQNISRKMTLPVAPDVKSSKPSQSAATLSESLSSSDLSDSDSDNLSNQVGAVKEEVKKNEEKVNHPREPTPTSKPFRGQKRAVPLTKDFKTELTKLRDCAASINKLLSKAEPKLNVLLEKSELCGEYYMAVGGAWLKEKGVSGVNGYLVEQTFTQETPFSLTTYHTALNGS